MGSAWPTVHRRFARWSKDRFSARLYRVILDELGARGELDWSRFSVDSVGVRVSVVASMPHAIFYRNRGL